MGSKGGTWFVPEGGPLPDPLWCVNCTLGCAKLSTLDAGHYWRNRPLGLQLNSHNDDVVAARVLQGVLRRAVAPQISGKVVRGVHGPRVK